MGIVSMGDERAPMVGWCQYLYEHFDWVDLKRAHEESDARLSKDVDKRKP